MNLEFDKEMDSLLRDHPAFARKRGATGDTAPDFIRRDAEEAARAATRHLDVDELSAYAENALPAATRARYVAHLADCETCRQLVTNIAIASDVAGALERSAPAGRTFEETPAAASGWRARLASFFDSPSLRYALPVVLLLVTGAIIYVATLTRQKSPMSLATRVVKEDVPRATAPGDTDTRANDSIDAADRQSVAETTEATPAAVNQAMPQQKGAGESPRQVAESKKTEAFAGLSEADRSTNLPAAPAGTPNASASQPAASELATLSPAETRPAQRAEDATNSLIKGKDAASSTTTTAAPPAKESVSVADEDGARAERAEEVAVTGGNKVVNAPPARREQSGARRDELASADGRQAQKIETARQARPVAPSAGPEGEASGAVAPTVRRRAGPRAASDADSEPPAETRGVAGRRFRRQGGAWVDTEYKSSNSLTTVARGSEQYRALVADEPDLRRVAEQLGGEVIVVWKNRAYRIK